MRFLVLSVSALCAVCLGSGHAVAQTSEILPYSTHVDRRHGNDHVYPDRGAIVRDLPGGSVNVDYAGISYRFVGDVWYQRLGPAYMVVEPPLGVVIPRPPARATYFEIAGKPYFYANDVFYRARADGSYEVVNDPQDEVSENAAAPSDSSSPAVASAAPTMVAAAAPSADESQTELTTRPDPDVAAPTTPGNPTQIAIHPRNGQSADQEAVDRYECYRFGVAQSGYDPLATHGSASARNDPGFSRAQAECLEGRGYNVP